VAVKSGAFVSLGYVREFVCSFKREVFKNFHSYIAVVASIMEGSLPWLQL
jgi:hypothetical protein